MNLQKALMIASILVGTGSAISVVAQDEPGTPPGSQISISPASGTYMEGQKIEFVVSIPEEILSGYPLEYPYYNPIVPSLSSPPPPPPSSPSPLPSQLSFKATLNDKDVTNWLTDCMLEYKSPSSTQKLMLCRAMDSSPFVVGDNNLKVTFSNLSVGEFSAQASYQVVASQRAPHTTNYIFFVRGYSLNTPSGVFATAVGQKFLVGFVSGIVNVWPAVSGYIVGPRGAGSCASTCLLPTGPLGAVVYKIGQNGRWQTIPTNNIVVSDRAGELIFAVNDKVDINDNIGEFAIRVAPQ